MDYAKESLRLHGEWKGKIEVTARVPVETKDDLSLAYTPGVAQPCLEIQKDLEKSYELTRRWNLCAVITDGSAVLGLGDIGPEAGMPVMEGKCVLFKAFGDVDAFPLCVRTHDVDEFVNTVALISGSFGGVNLEDISAPRCFEIERKLKERCDIPIFHDDQHGTAVITLAGLTNALKVVGKKKEDVRIVTSGAGAAAIAIVGTYTFRDYKESQREDQLALAEEARETQQQEPEESQETNTDLILNTEEPAEEEDTDMTEEEEETASQENGEKEEAVQSTSSQIPGFTSNSKLLWPVDGNVLLSFSMDKTVYFSTLDQYKYNPAMVISGAEGDQVIASAPGIVKSIDVTAETGTTVNVDLGNGYELFYGQLKEVPVKAGDYVDAKTVLGYVGQPTKYYSVEGCNVYFEMRKDGQPVNPMEYLVE